MLVYVVSRIKYWNNKVVLSDCLVYFDVCHDQLRGVACHFQVSNCGLKGMQTSNIYLWAEKQLHII